MVATYWAVDLSFRKDNALGKYERLIGHCPTRFLRLLELDVAGLLLLDPAASCKGRQDWARKSLKINRLRRPL